jgi:hypothetical protein
MYTSPPLFEHVTVRPCLEYQIYDLCLDLDIKRQQIDTKL